MKKFIFLFLIAYINANAQKELWGVTRATNFSDVQGNIVKFDINGEKKIMLNYAKLRIIPTT